MNEQDNSRINSSLKVFFFQNSFDLYCIIEYWKIDMEKVSILCDSFAFQRHFSRRQEGIYEWSFYRPNPSENLIFHVNYTRIYRPQVVYNSKRRARGQQGSITPPHLRVGIYKVHSVKVMKTFSFSRSSRHHHLNISTCLQ